MGRVVPFSAADRYVKELAGKGHSVRAILDTNVLIASSYEIKDTHEQVVDLLRKLDQLGVKYFATVTTKAEFMEFQRRLMLTETLIDLVDGHSKVKVPKAAVDEIRKSVASMNSKRARDGSDPIFNDAQIKSIKAEFSAGSHSGQIGWLRLCDTFLKGYVSEIEGQLHERGIVYLSPNDPGQEIYGPVPVARSDFRRLRNDCVNISDLCICMRAMMESALLLPISLLTS